MTPLISPDSSGVREDALLAVRVPAAGGPPTPVSAGLQQGGQP